jgi:bifunctional non-homologous end joining protein LigD
MSQPRNKVRNSKQSSQSLSKPLKKLPAKKKDSKGKKNTSISIDLHGDKINLASIIELEKRKLSNSKATKMPEDIKPMLATLVDEPFNDDNWQFELKLDGYRCLSYLQNGNVDIRSRNNNSFNTKFETVYQTLKDWKVNAIVDGEIVVLNESGVPDFNGIQLWEKKKEGQLVYYVFDLLWLDGLNIMEEPLYLRQEILKKIIPENGIIRFSDHIDAIGIDFFEIARENNLEGIIAKKKDSIYIPDSRSKTWLKIKAEQRHEAIICGYTKKRDSDRLFSSLVLGVYEKDKLVFIGQTGTGFTQQGQQDLVKKMKPHITKNCPFEVEPNLSDTVVWLKPFLVGEVKYTELTPEGIMRHASFQGLREDKVAFELNNEKEQDINNILSNPAPDQFANPLVLQKDKEKIVLLNGHDLKLTNLDKVFWPKEKITKGDLVNYYHRMEEYIMPYLLDRPQSLNRYPNGIEGKSFYHKNMGEHIDKWIKTFERLSDSSGPKNFLICTDVASLIYMVNLGCIEINPWHSRIQKPNNPDWCVIDLDPGHIAFEKVIETALVVKKVLDSLQIHSYPKTSGSTGIHIYIPLGGKYNYEQSKQLAELIANVVHEELPGFTSLVRSPIKRMDKIYLDYLQNRPIQTICSPYSIRPKPGATVSTPLHWDEVKKGLKTSDFTMKNIIERLKSEGDLFKGVLEKGIDLNSILKGLSNLI